MIRCALIATFFLTFWGTAIAQPANPVFDIPKLQGVVIDGNPADWNNGGFHVGLLADEARAFLPAKDYDGQIWLAWDDAGLLLRVRVLDDVFVEHPQDGLLWALDAIEVFVASDVGSTERYQPVISPGCTPDEPELRYKLYDFREDKVLREHPLSMEAARTKIPGGYVLEARFPWSNLGLTPHPGMFLGFQTYLNDADYQDMPLGQRYTAMWYPLGGSQYDTEHMYRLRLEDTASPPVLAMANLKRFTEVPLCWVQVNATEDLTGKSVTVSGTGVDTTEVPLHAFDGRSAADCYLGLSSPSALLSDLQILCDGQPVQNIAHTETGTPTLSFEIATTAKGAQTITPVLDPPGAIPGRARKAQLRVYAEDGTELLHKKVRLGEALPAALPDGLYLVRATYADGSKTTLRGTLGFYLGAEPSVDDLAKRVASLHKDLGGGFDDYAGWFHFQMRELTDAASDNRETLNEQIQTLTRWLIEPRIVDQAWTELRGPQEWAYLSKIDGTGQPFTLTIPWNYDPAKPWPLFVYLHGSGQSFRGAEDQCGAVVLKVLGRAMDSGYANLCETDVLEAMAYVRAHWNIDPNRINLYGHSMGGGGTFFIGSRHPDLFASARPLAGYGLPTPVRNLLNVPTYVLHGTDDYVVPLFEATAALRLLAKEGGQTRMHLEDGVGHGASSKEALSASQDWALKQVRNERPKRVHYEAQDELASGAYWLRVLERGPEAHAAILDGTIGTNNTLYLNLANARAVAIDLSKAPVEADKPLGVVINQLAVGEIHAPLSDVVYATQSGDAWQVSRVRPDTPEFRLHFGVGAHAAYLSEPLMVVWGTQGDEATNKNMYDLAQLARVWANGDWSEDEGDGQIHHMPYGLLRGKPDTEVTQDDMDRYNLVLLGTAAQNEVVAKLADQLPVRTTEDQVVASDGTTWGFEGCGLSLLYMNPLAPHRLILWRASNDPAFYTRGTPLFETSDSVDFCMGDATEDRVVAGRNFDSRWQWQAGYDASALLPKACCGAEGFQKATIDAVARKTEADFVVVVDRSTDPPVFTAGESRVADVLAVMGWAAPVVTIRATGSEISDARARFKEVDPKDWWHGPLLIVKAEPEAPIDPNREYIIALPSWYAWQYASKTESSLPDAVVASESLESMLADYLR